MNDIVLLTDFGVADWYVATMKGVIRAIAPDACLIDLTHEVEPGDIAQADFILAQAAPHFRSGTIFLVVVDPGVGSGRRALACSDGERFFIAPDNGVLSSIAREAGTNWRVHAIENGKDMVGRSLVAFGGAAPLHAARLADKLGIDTVIVPEGAGVGSAIGFLRAQISYEVVRTRYMDLRQFDPSVVNDIFAEMRKEAEAVVRLGAPDEPLVEIRSAFMRYRGQGHEIDAVS